MRSICPSSSSVVNGLIPTWRTEKQLRRKGSCSTPFPFLHLQVSETFHTCSPSCRHLPSSGQFRCSVGEGGYSLQTSCHEYGVGVFVIDGNPAWALGSEPPREEWLLAFWTLVNEGEQISCSDLCMPIYPAPGIQLICFSIQFLSFSDSFLCSSTLLILSHWFQPDPVKTAGNRGDTLPHLAMFPTLVAAVSCSGRGRQGTCEP